MRTRITTLARRWCTTLRCTNWEDYEFKDGKMVAAKCKCGTWVRF